uniref:Uncharacterized protein n=1 Tax=Anguilla anguilla TaxID=7936 RepID=A0A0E9U8U4_ANGAN
MFKKINTSIGHSVSKQTKNTRRTNYNP